MIGFKNGVEVEENNVVRGFSSDTEVKTNHGWKLISQVDPERDMILVAEADTREISYSQPLRVSVTPYEGTLMHLETRQVNLMLTDKTPLHLVRKHTCEGKCVYTPQQVENAEEKKNRDLLPLSGFRYHNGNEMEFVLPAVTVTKRKKEVTYPEKRIDMKSWLEFFGFWLADGCCRGPLSNGTTLYAVFIKQPVLGMFSRIRVLHLLMIRRFHLQFRPALHQMNIRFITIILAPAVIVLV